MIRFRSLTLMLLTSSAIALAQDPQTGGWRRAGDPPPVPQEQAAPPAQGPGATWPGQDPSQPVDRSDAYGQPGVEQQPQPQQRNDRPPTAMRTSPPPYGLPPEVTIKPGTFVMVRTNQPLSSDRNQEGDVFSATLTQPIVVDGIVVAQRGQSVMGRVAEAQKAGRVSGVSHLKLQLTGLTLADGTQANIQSQMVTRNGHSSVGNDVAAVGTTTAVGAAVGAAADWGRGAAIGAGAGAVVGLAGVLLTRGQQTIVYPETLLTFRVDTPVTVSTARAPQAFRYVDPYEYDRPDQPQIVRERRPAPAYVYGAPPPYYGGYYGYGPYYPYPYWGWGGGFGVVIGHGGYRRWR